MLTKVRMDFELKNREPVRSESHKVFAESRVVLPESLHRDTKIMQDLVTLNTARNPRRGKSPTYNLPN